MIKWPIGFSTVCFDTELYPEVCWFLPAFTEILWRNNGKIK